MWEQCPKGFPVIAHQTAETEGGIYDMEFSPLPMTLPA